MRQDNLRMIFHYYDCDSNLNDFHLAILKEYKDIFDEVIIVISTDTPEDSNKMGTIEEKFIKIGFRGDITFKIRKNNNIFREGLTYWNEIVQKLDDLDGLTFFAHSKGITNINMGVNKELVKNWICFMYYMNLTFIREVKWMLLEKREGLSYGTLLFDESRLKEQQKYSVYDWNYAGSFHWLNTLKISSNMKNKGMNIPPIFDRYYAECGFLPNIFPIQYATSHHMNYIIKNEPWSMYANDFFEKVKLILSEEEINSYKAFYNKIITNETETHNI